MGPNLKTQVGSLTSEMIKNTENEFISYYCSATEHGGSATEAGVTADGPGVSAAEVVGTAA